MAARGGAEACGLVTEAWSAGGDEKRLTKALTWRGKGRSLAEMPEREEVLLVAVASAAGEVHRVFKIERGEDGISLRPRPRSGTPTFDAFLTALPWAGEAALKDRALADHLHRDR